MEFKLLVIEDDEETMNNDNFDVDIPVNNNSKKKEPIHKKLSKFIHSDAVYMIKNAIIMIIITVSILSVVYTINFSKINANSNDCISANLVSSHYDYKPSFSGFEFTRKLVKLCRNKDVDLYGILISNNSNNIPTFSYDPSRITADEARELISHLVVTKATLEVSEITGTEYYNYIIDYK